MPRYIHMYVSKISTYLKYLINEASLVKKFPLPCSFIKVKSASKSQRSIIKGKIKAAHLLGTWVFGMKFTSLHHEMLRAEIQTRSNTNNSPAFNGLGTPPTKTVFLGSNGNEASSTKSASLNLQGRIWTGLSLMVGLETHKYSLSSSWMQASIKAWTDDSSWKEIKYFQFLEN